MKATNNDVIKKLDEVMGELQKMREEFTLIQGKYEQSTN